MRAEAARTGASRAINRNFGRRRGSSGGKAKRWLRATRGGTASYMIAFEQHVCVDSSAANGCLVENKQEGWEKQTKQRVNWGDGLEGRILLHSHGAFVRRKQRIPFVHCVFCCCFFSCCRFGLDVCDGWVLPLGTQFVCLMFIYPLYACGRRSFCIASCVFWLLTKYMMPVFYCDDATRGSGCSIFEPAGHFGT